MPAPPKLRSDLVVSPSVVDGATVYTVKDPLLGNYYRLREPEFWLINQFDGRTSPEALAEAFRARFQLNISAEDVAQFAAAMDRLLFLENNRADQAVSRLGCQAGQSRSFVARLLYLKVRGFRPGRFLDRLTAAYRPFHRLFWFILQAAFILLGLWLLADNAASFEIDLAQLWHVRALVLLVISLFVLVSLHEFAHAVVCRMYGGEVREIGFLLLYFQPCFYCDLSDAWLFSKKSQRVAVTLAGPYAQLLLLAGSVILWRLTVAGSFINDLAWMLTSVNWLIYLFNFNPLIKLDGYYLLSDWLDIPNLRQKAFGWLGNVIKRRLLGWDIEPVAVTGRERTVFIAYGLLALIYSALLLGYLFWVAASFILERLGPTGLILFLAALALILSRTLKQLIIGVAAHIAQMRKLIQKPWRLAAYVLLLVLLVVVLVAVPVPRRVSGDVTVRPIAEFAISLTEIGLLESRTRYGGESPETKTGFLQMATSDVASLRLTPLVKDGQLVTEGDTLAIVASNQINQQIETGQAELARLNDKLTLLKAQPKREQIAEARAQVDAATSALELVRREHARISSLVQSGSEANDRLESSQASLEIAEAELDNKQSTLDLLLSPPRPEEVAVLQREIEKQEAHLSFLREQADAQHITTPIAGSVVIQRKSGCLLEVLRQDTVEVVVPVSDFDIALIELNQPVKLRVRSYPEQTFAGRVVRIPGAAAGGRERTEFPVTAVVENHDGLLRDGMTGYAKINTGTTSVLGLAFRRLLSVLKVEFWSWF